MKRLTLLLALVALAGCDNGRVDTSSVAPDVTVAKTKYNGHSYLVFSFNNDHGGGIEHDPECDHSAHKGQ